jgi:hypothetical protein
LLVPGKRRSQRFQHAQRCATISGPMPSPRMTVAGMCAE